MLFPSIKTQTVTKKLSTNISIANLRKVLERLLYNSNWIFWIFEFFIQNNLIIPNHSGFKIGDLCINQLVSITHEIYKSFDDGYEVQGVFFNISKAFDKVCQPSFPLQTKTKWYIR